MGGFEGLGVEIEVQSCGCPVFASNRKPTTDVGGDGAVYFDPEDEIGAAEMINSSIKNTSRLIQSGFQDAATYTTEEMISGYIAKYPRLLE